MKDLSPLIYFIFGILFYELMLPILSQLSEIIQGFCQLILGKQAVKMAEYNKIIEKNKEDKEESQSTFAMGFQLSPQNDEENEEEEEDDE